MRQKGIKKTKKAIFLHPPCAKKPYSKKNLAEFGIFFALLTNIT